MHRPMVALVHLALLARVEVVHAHPGVVERADDKAVAQVWVERGGCRGVGEGDGDWGVLPVDLAILSRGGWFVFGRTQRREKENAVEYSFNGADESTNPLLLSSGHSR